MIGQPIGLQGGAKETTLQEVRDIIPDSGEQSDLLPLTQMVLNAGDNLIHTPAAGKRIQLEWVYAVSKPSATTSPTITIKIGTKEFFKVFAVSKRQKCLGELNQPLVVNLDEAGQVAFTAFYKEV